MIDISAIRDYILFLKKEQGLSVTLHPHSEDPVILPSPLMAFNIHDNPYCIYIKSCPEARKHCVNCQQKVAERAKSGSYCGCCYAGVLEYVYPLAGGGFLCVSGYQSPAPESYLRRVAERYPLSTEKLRQVYGALKKELPPKARVELLITPLLQMLELAAVKSREQAGGRERFADRVARYLKQCHTRSITSAELCRHFACSRSYLSHTFNQQMGQTIKQYLTDLRMEDARILLRHSDLSVTEIALSVGYNDPNYFSGLFKKEVGQNPRDYRKGDPQ